MGDGRLVHVAGAVELVAVRQVEPALRAGHARRGLGIDRPRRVEISVGLLGGGDLRDPDVDLLLELGIGLEHQDIGRGLDDLVDVGIVEGVGGLELPARRALERGRGELEVLDPLGVLALLHLVGDGDGDVTACRRAPEAAVELDRGHGHGLDGIVLDGGGASGRGEDGGASEDEQAE